MKALLHCLLASCLLLTITGCPEEEPTPPPPPATENIYAGCCGTDPVTAEVGLGKLYIPNLFTPNNDGINDVFLVNATPEVERIANFQILNRKDSVIFELVTQNPNAIVWVGEMGNGEAYNGRFSYKMTVSDQNGAQMELTGEACAFRCDTTSSLIETHSQCRFPDQYDGNGGVDLSFNSLVLECL